MTRAPARRHGEDGGPGRDGIVYWQCLPQSETDFCTQEAVQESVQQVESAWQTLAVQGPQLERSGAPVTHTPWVQAGVPPPPPPQVWWQTDFTSATHCRSQEVPQQ